MKTAFLYILIFSDGIFVPLLFYIEVPVPKKWLKSGCKFSLVVTVTKVSYPYAVVLIEWRHRLLSSVLPSLLPLTQAMQLPLLMFTLSFCSYEVSSIGEGENEGCIGSTAEATQS